MPLRRDDLYSLKDIGEKEAIARIAGNLPGGDNVIVGVGDDCAVVRVGAEDLVLTSDPVIEHVHFDTGTPCAAIGRKAVGRALSDIAAMGAVPRWALVDVVAPGEFPVSDLDALYEGINALAAQHGLAIVGGDLARGHGLEIHLFAVGSVASGQAVLRSGAGVGDCLFVTGALGGSRFGRHLTFAPRVAEGRWLRDWATSMIDISDGLAGDLRIITEQSGVGCSLDLKSLPIASDAVNAHDGRTAVEHAIYDGEDFELLFTIRSSDRDRFINEWSSQFDTPCSEIGCITSEANLIRCRQSDDATYVLSGSGFSHF